MNQIKRVRYKKCPLVEVVYQLNFPTILAIEAEEPAEFQNAIRRVFPKYKMRIEQEGEITVNVKGEEFNPMFRQRPVRKLYDFISEDGQWKVTLAKNMLSISTFQYKQWEDMNDKFQLPLNSFTRIYEQSYFERVGLRYVDAIDKKALGLDEVEWKELIQPHLLGCLGLVEERSMKVKSSIFRSELAIDDISVKLSAGLGMVNKSDGDSLKKAFIIDCDYFKFDKMYMDNLPNVVERLHLESTSFFRNSITDKLHNSMEPEEIG